MKKQRVKELSKVASLVIAILSTPYFMSTTGVVYKAFGYNVADRIELPFSYVLSGEGTGLVGVATTSDITCAKWLANESDINKPIAAGYNARRLLASFLSQDRLYFKSPHRPVTPEEAEHCYIFYTEWNIEHEFFVSAESPGLRIMEPLEHYSYPIAFKSGKAVIYEK